MKPAAAQEVIMSVCQVTGGLFLSGLDAARSRSLISSRNITLIINASGQDVSYPHGPGVEVVPVPVPDSPHAPLARYFEPVAERIDGNRTGNTLVHCTAGRSRSAALVIAYLMRCEGVSLRQAHEALLEKRPHIRPNAGFWRQLMEYERALFGRNTVRMTVTSCGVLPEALDPDGAAAYCINI
ncbi:dual specificity protein phosphatase 14 [Myripristis murdjan]|uniref:dual specificity protein phosphatase 14 n=1 Tax=Myripristis murdjan TaxID=586833 RepID=UPI001175D5BB|nr:dual specificity protein phosphatase 14-like [Myripristis murdjan]